MAKNSNVEKAAKDIKKMNIKGVSAKVVNIRKFTSKQKESIAKAQQEIKNLLKGGKKK